MEMIRCPRCAREIPDFSRFCRRCGCAIVWRGQIGAAAIPPIPAQVNRGAVTLGSGRQAKPVTKPPPNRVKPSVRSSGSGGAGIFAIFAAAGLVCFVNYHAVMRPVSTPAVRYQLPAMPEIGVAEGEEVSAPYLAPPPPRRYVSQPPPRTLPMPRTAGALRSPDGIIATPPPPPVSPWDTDRYRPSPRDERDRGR